MSNDDTPRSAARLTIEDFIVREMRTGFRDVHNRIDDYRGEAQRGNAKLEEHITTCDKRYAEMLSARQSGTNRAMTRDWIVERIKERAFDYVLVSVIVLIVYAFAHGAKLPVLS